MSKYKILGRSGAGSLIPEFLLTELGIDYDIEFPKPADLRDHKYIGFNPLGKSPVIICPNGLKIFETVAIVTHITTRFGKLIPATQDTKYLIYWQILSLLATSVYPAYHRQHHSRKYVEETGITSLKIHAQAEQAIIFDYLEELFSPFLLGEEISAVDFYLYTLTRWDLDKSRLREGRPNLKAFLDILRSRDAVRKVLNAQPKKVSKEL